MGESEVKRLIKLCMHIITMLETATVAIKKNSRLILVDEKTLLKKVPQNQLQEKSVKMNIQTYHIMITNSIKNSVLVNSMCQKKLVRTYNKNLKMKSLKGINSKLWEYCCINNFNLTKNRYNGLTTVCTGNM